MKNYLGCFFMYQNKRWKITAKSSAPGWWIGVWGSSIQYFNEETLDKLNILCYNQGTKTREDNKMMNYLFVDNETGERFFVQANSFKEAEEIAYDNFDDPEYIDEFTDAEAEWFGYDTY